MAITAAQRKIAVDKILGAYGEDDVLNHLVPGLNTPAVLTAITNAIGTGVDATLTTCLATMVADENALVTKSQSTTTGLQANVTAWTVV